MNNNEKSPASSEGVRFVKTTRTKSGRKNGKFNFVDAFLILIILATIAALVAYFLPGITTYFTQEEEAEITYVIEFKGVDIELASKIKGNDSVFDANQNYEIGRVEYVSVDNYKMLTYNETEEKAELMPHPELKTVTVTVKGSAVYKEGEGYFVNGQRIAVGKQFNVKFPNYAGSGYCIDIDVEQ